MVPERFAALVNLAGFTAALALYAMLLAMVVRSPQAALVTARVRRISRRGSSPRAPGVGRDRLLVVTAALGIVWNIGAIGVFGLEDFGIHIPPAGAALSFAALGFLPAVVVHGALRSLLVERREWTASAIVGFGYVLSVVAAGMHVTAAWQGGLRSVLALWVLMAGFLGLVVLLALRARRHVNARGALSIAALAVFAVSALHLAQHEALKDSWPLEIIGHHASLPLALAILYQDYPFALADLFLKRALMLVLAVTLVLSAYAVTSWWQPDLPQPGLLLGFLGLGFIMAIGYPLLRSGAHWFVDTVVLARPDYATLRAVIAQSVSDQETAEQIVRTAGTHLARALGARDSSYWTLDAAVSPLAGCEVRRAEAGSQEVADAHEAWLASEHGEVVHGNRERTAAVVIVPTAESPCYAIRLGTLAGGRRLLSDDLSMLAAVAQTIARRIHMLRLTRERCEQRVREADIQRLATEAELRALRAQVNPHFLFNALTTIGFLIQTAPPVAVEKLLQLTELLRRVLRSEGEFTTLGKEIELVRLYLDLEQARFEERLQIDLDVPRALHEIPVPTLILQPIVENAIKHGIASQAAGGLVQVTASLEPSEGRDASPRLRLTVRDTGRGLRRAPAESGGIGLRNVEQRLALHYGAQAALTLDSSEHGTVVTLMVPAMSHARAASSSAESVTS